MVSTGLRRALKRRDKGCRFPGCEQTHYVDAHHIHHWAHGGETNLENLVLLCRYHHRHLHEGGYAIEKEATKIRFTDPSGIDIPTVADDLSQGSRDTLMKSVPAGTLLAADSLTPEMDWRPPDYHHIAWVLAQIA
ncbi:MAG: HNH endonuclease signature motif containing protein [Gammaproteobacteria bacterium]|nr:HNH endonuclease signature motif containing protein [Gammaproteobacteria bacterium]